MERATLAKLEAIEFLLFVKFVSAANTDGWLIKGETDIRLLTWLGVEIGDRYLSQHQ